MNQSTTRIFDELAKVLTNAAGAAQGVRSEVDTLLRNQAERILNDMDLVNREEFEVVKEMASRARQENEELKMQVAALETKLGKLSKSKPATRKRAPAKKPKADAG